MFHSYLLGDPSRSLTNHTFEIFRLSKLITDDIVYFLPRNADMNQVCFYVLDHSTSFIAKASTLIRYSNRWLSLYFTFHKTVNAFFNIVH